MTPSFVPGIKLRCDSGKTSLTSLYGVRPQDAAYHTKTTSLGTFRDPQNPCLCSTYTIKSAVSYLSSRHHYQRINPGTPLITQWMQKPMKKICAEFNVDKNTDWRQKLDDNGGLGIIFNYITSTGYQPLKGFSYDAHQMSFTDYNKGKLHIDYISQQHGMPGQHSYLISQTVLHDQALSVSMNQSGHIAGQSLVLNLRLNQISSGLGAHLMRRNNFLLILKMQSRALWIYPARLLDTRTHSNTHAPRWIMYLGLVCTWHPVIWNCG